MSLKNAPVPLSLTAIPQAPWLQQRLAKDAVFAEQFALVWGCSDFVAEQCSANPALFQGLVESGDLARSYSDDTYLQRLQQPLIQIETEEQLSQQLRVFRRREMIRIVWRDFTRSAPMLETTRDATLLAEACIVTALDFLHRITCVELGTPVAKSGEEQRLVVIAMGKMGAYELNISSDIDLIFAYPESGETQGATRSISNQEFFIRLGQKLIAALDRHTVDGFVFRVDMRLRPYGQSGALVLNFAALEEYYLTQGRDWERYAMIKARVVAGEPADAQYLHAMLRPFIYRKYLDFGSIESLRDLKRAINREVSRKGMQDNIKLGPGGIREVEFIAQTLQLIRGGRDVRLQTQSLHQALELLAAEQVIAVDEQQGLWQAYEFLRNTEHALQGIADRQTQELPQDALGQQRVALLLDCANWADFYQQLQIHRDHVRSSFADIISEGPAQAGESIAGGDNIWQQNPDAEAILEHLHELGYQQPQEVATQLAGFYQSRLVQNLDALPRTRLEGLLPKLTQVCGARADNSLTLGRTLGLIQGVLRRSAYLALLAENPQALEQLAVLCERSSWIADELAAYPALLDELLDPRSLYTAPNKQVLRDQLRQQMLRIPDEDQEQQMEAIRYFCRSYTLRVAACELMDVLPLMQVSDYLTWIADVVVEHVVNVAWQQLAATYGQPQAAKSALNLGAPNLEAPDLGSLSQGTLNQGTLNQGTQTPGFIVVAYGKMGGIELGYKSDLDLVFIHNAQANQVTDGPRSIDNSTFFVRLGQRIIHLLSTPTHSGIAYEIDMRLRPSGNSGMLVASLIAFEKYQHQGAWTWEHQALVRARVVAGDPNLAADFNKVRDQVLRQPRDAQSLATEVQQMREKMRKHLDRGTKDGKFSLKQGTGGIVDIEFMVQFAVLAWSHDHPSLTRWSDSIRIIESLAKCGLLDEQNALRLIDAYKSFRIAGHRLQLHNQLVEVAVSEFVEQRKIVVDQWHTFFSN
ncbi:bifunctional [glutamate--ammonia ligase]-adenylyl-L-tyrosine phosphorylase/[glutamate--ammonia-ligase] adenylyltransferase [Porticoccaceae bacterium]|nr:bifunctional [glutamate--ammonia ligase]-adenylyl-L-tyrosine phosphorylase/[glutamate--ammonia-ligase] adenylyltransferase [Porticoccaceae bacterium]